MRRRTTPLTYEEVLMKYTSNAARYLVKRYFSLNLDIEDVTSELRVWVLGDGKERVERWLANEPQQTTRCYRSLLDEGVKKYEALKAEVEGYKLADVYNYSPRIIQAVMPYVVNPEFTENNGRIGELITTVLDIRRVMTPELYEYFQNADPEVQYERGPVQQLINLLNGRVRPHGRRSITNAHAHYITKEQEQ